MQRFNLFLILWAALVWIHSPAQAAKLFAMTVDLGTPIGSEQIFVENPSLPDLISDLIHARGDFADLDDEDHFTANLRFFALPDALKIDVQKPGQVGAAYIIKLSSSLSNLDVTFESIDADDLRKEVVDWFYLSGGDEAREFLIAVTQASTAAITDGGPGATTAQMADTTFQLFGFYPSSGNPANMRGYESGAYIGLQVDGDSFRLESPSGPVDGSRLRASVPLWLHFNRRLSYAGQIQFNYSDVEGTKFYGLGADLGLAFRPVLRTGEDRFGWQITPYVGGHGIGSVDGVTAGLLYHYGLNNRFEFRCFQRCLLSWVTQYDTFENLNVTIDQYQVTSQVNQALLKNGLMYEFPLFSLQRFYGQLQLVDTRFLKDAQYDNYQTYGGGLAYKRESFSINTLITFDHTDNYEGTHAKFNLSWDL